MDFICEDEPDLHEVLKKQKAVKAAASMPAAMVYFGSS